MNGFLAIAWFKKKPTTYDDTPMRFFPTLEEAEQWVEDFEPSGELLERILSGKLAPPSWFELLEFRDGVRVVTEDDGEELLPSRKGRDPETTREILRHVEDGIARTGVARTS